MQRLVLIGIFLFWAAIYLPGLGSVELKGEEGRRSLPAVAMLDTGNWLVPYLNGKPYARKPPLVNWLIAASMKVTGERNEWAARLPSALAMLALGLVTVWTGSRWLTPGGGFTAAVFMLTSIAFIEKGRLAEIEALYVACTGIAFAWWLAAWANRETGWRLWLLPGIALGLGLLAKGPTHLLFFYGVAIPVLVATGEKRQLWSAAHLVSLALAALLFLAWEIPYNRVNPAAAAVWVDQMKGRVGGGTFEIANLPRALCNGLPWILFAPLAWNRRVLAALGGRDERLRGLVCAARWPLALLFVGPMLIPGMLPRYTLPVFPAIALLLALLVREASPRALAVWRQANRGVLGLVLVGALVLPWIPKPIPISTGGWGLLVGVAAGLLAALVWETRRRESAVAFLAAGSALAIAAAMLVYAVAVIPRMASHEDLRPFGEAVNATVPQSVPLYVVDPGYEPSLFYVRRACHFVDTPGRLPLEARYVLVRRNDLRRVKSRFPRALDAAHLTTKGKKDFLLLKLAPESEKTAPLPDA